MALGSQLTWWEGPPVLRRQVRNYVLGAILCSAAAAAFLILRDPLGVPREPYGRFGALVIGLVPIVVLWPMFLLGRRRIRRQFDEARGRLCTHCAYNLLPMGEKGTCAECGHAFDAQTDAETWRSARFHVGKTR